MTKQQPEPTVKKSKKESSKQKVEELTHDLQRVTAEFINFKRRSEQDKSRALALGKEHAVMGLLPIIDNLERAIAHEPQDIKDHAWVKGVGAIAKQLQGLLTDLGLKQIGVVGEAFNPDIHEAVSMQDGEGNEEIVVGVAQIGYMLDDRVIRHAIVQVGKK